MMEQPIQNKVAASGLVSLDLEELYVPGERAIIDISPWLFEGVILREKLFREHLDSFDWSMYQDKLISVICSADAIIPTWAYMLVSAKLQPYATHFVFGNAADLEKSLFFKALEKIKPEDYAGARVVIKGCSKVEVPIAVYVEITRMLKPVVKSIFYGEPCSTVPIYKAPK